MRVGIPGLQGFGTGGGPPPPPGPTYQAKIAGRMFDQAVTFTGGPNSLTWEQLYATPEYQVGSGNSKIEVLANGGGDLELNLNVTISGANQPKEAIRVEINLNGSAPFWKSWYVINPAAGFQGFAVTGVPIQAVDGDFIIIDLTYEGGNTATVLGWEAPAITDLCTWFNLKGPLR